jgi:hypothetical protein
MEDILQIKQFTPVYDEKEDRLRLIFNINYPTRYDVWITRKFLIDILDNFSDYIKPQEIKESQNSNTEENQNAQNNIYPPTNDEIRLLETINANFNQNGVILTFKDSKTTLQAALTYEELKSLLETITARVKHHWGLYF